MKYIIGLLVGGLMEDPDFRFTGPYDIIEANSDKEAQNIYNKKYKCNYFSGEVMCTITDNNITNINPDCSYNECLEVFEDIEINSYEKN